MSIASKIALAAMLLIASSAHATKVFMNFASSDTRYAPFPSESLRNADGTINWQNLSNNYFDTYGQIGIFGDALTQVANAPPQERGFGTTSTIFFGVNAKLDPTTLPNLDPNRTTPPPDPHASIATSLGVPQASVFLIGVQSGSPDYGKLYPVIVSSTSDNSMPVYSFSEWQCDDVLSGNNCVHGAIALAPLQGAPLLPNTLYAAVVTDKVKDATGNVLQQDPSDWNALFSGNCPSGLSNTAPTGMQSPCQSYLSALTALNSLVPNFAFHVRGLAVFRTADPTAVFRAALNDALAPGHFPTFPTSPALDVTDFPFPTPGVTGLQGTVAPGTFPGYCVYQGTIKLPMYQQGTPPYMWNVDGAIAFESQCLLAALAASPCNAFPVDPLCWATALTVSATACGVVSPTAPDAFIARSQGHWQYDVNGIPQMQSTSLARVIITVPRKTPPAGGFPTVVFERAGAGGDIALVNRGASTAETLYHEDPNTTGTGPAQEFARAGFAAIQVDNPMAAARTPGATWHVEDEDSRMFNIMNLGALRDNIRQAALELALVAHALPTLSLDASDCQVTTAGLTGKAVGVTTLNPMVMMGHSVGATVAPLALGGDPSSPIQAAILTGSGGSWISNALYKQQPRQGLPFSLATNFDMRGALEAGMLLRQSIEGETNPALGLLQWVGENADPPVYNRITANRLYNRQQTILTLQGIVDHYIEPPIANAANLSLGLALGTQPGAGDLVTLNNPNVNYSDFSGPHGPGDFTFPVGAIVGVPCYPNDVPGMSAPCGPYAANSDFRAFQPLSGLINLAAWSSSTPGRNLLTLPWQGASMVTQHLRQYDLGSDAVTEDGHEVDSQELPPKHQYKCFLRSLLLASQYPPPAGFQNGPMVPAETDPKDCWDHAPNVVGNPLINTSDCCVAIICQSNPNCCKSVWDDSCKAAYESTYPTCQVQCAYYGSSDIMTPGGGDLADYQP